MKTLSAGTIASLTPILRRPGAHRTPQLFRGPTREGRCVNRGHKLLLWLALAWAAFDFWIVARNVILRETFLSPFSTVFDRMPETGRNLIWIILLFGWMIPLGLGLAP